MTIYGITGSATFLKLYNYRTAKQCQKCTKIQKSIRTGTLTFNVRSKQITLNSSYESSYSSDIWIIDRSNMASKLANNSFSLQ